MESRRDRLSNECELQRIPARSHKPISAPTNPISEPPYKELLQHLASQILHFNDEAYREGDEK